MSSATTKARIAVRTTATALSGWRDGESRAQVCPAVEAADRMRWMTSTSKLVAAVPLPVRRAVRDGAVVAGLLFLAYLFVVVAPVAGTVGFDAFAYWNVNPADPYAVRRRRPRRVQLLAAHRAAVRAVRDARMAARSCGCGSRCSSATSSGSVDVASGSCGSSPSRRSPSSSITATSTCGSRPPSRSASAIRGPGGSCC